MIYPPVEGAAYATATLKDQPGVLYGRAYYVEGETCERRPETRIEWRLATGDSGGLTPYIPARRLQIEWHATADAARDQYMRHVCAYLDTIGARPDPGVGE